MLPCLVLVGGMFVCGCVWLVLRWWCVATIMSLVALTAFGFACWFDLILVVLVGLMGGLAMLLRGGWGGCFVVW